MECIGNQISCPPFPFSQPPPLFLRLLSCPSSSFRQTGNEGCAGESFSGILRMWRRPGMLGALMAAVAVFSITGTITTAILSPVPLIFPSLLAIHGDSTEIARDAKAARVQVRRNIRIGSTRLNGKSLRARKRERDREMSSAIGTLSARRVYDTEYASENGVDAIVKGRISPFHSYPFVFARV